MYKVPGKVYVAIALLCGLTACVTDPVEEAENQGYKYCGNKPQGNDYELVDSTATCGDGTPANMVFSRWLSTNGTCSVTRESDVFGGMAGIKRAFGCYDYQKKYVSEAGDATF